MSASATASFAASKSLRVGEQEAQRVADAPVRIDDARQDVVVDREVARVVGRGAPEADDLGAELGRHLVQGDEVAEALAHLAALAVDREAVRQAGRDTARGLRSRRRSAATSGTSHDAGRGLRGRGRPRVRCRRRRGSSCPGGCRAGRGRRSSRSRTRRRGCRCSWRSHGRVRAVVPSTSSAVRRDHASTPPAATIAAARSIRRKRVGMQLAGHLVQEERQRHAPVALPADAPVGPVRDHVVQAGAAVLRVEGGRVDGVERALAQGLRAPGRSRTRRASTSSASSMRTNHWAAAR